MNAESVVGVLSALERAFRELDPPRISELRQTVSASLAALESGPEPAGDADPADARLAEAAALGARAAHLFVDVAPPDQAIPRFFASLSAHARAQAALYALRGRDKAIGRYFALAEWHGRLHQLDPPTPDGVRVGLFESGGAADGGRGFSFYVPERYVPSRAWPLVVALHGGGGNGRDFLWTWLREARSRGYLLLAPSSHGSTWSFLGPDVDAVRLRSLLDWLAERWRIDASRVLLTGLSDGGTYTLFHGLAAGSHFAALAPGAGVLHPANLTNGNLERARGTPIYLMHGARDWLFPVALARAARALLEKAGARLEYRELADLAHAWPREENARILDWFGELHLAPRA